MKIKTSAPKRILLLSVVIALVGSLLSFVAIPASAAPSYPVTVNCGSSSYTIDSVGGEIVASGGEKCTGSVEIPAGVTIIGASAFWTAQITAITLPSSLKRIEASAIRSTRITSLVIPADVTFIGELGVASYYITSLTFAPNSHLAEIGPSAFQGLSITSISIPSSVRNMYANALETFGTLLTIRFEGNAPNIVGGSSLTGLLPNTTFLTSPEATGFVGSGWSGLTIVSPPDAPTNLIATVGAGQVSIAFTSGSNNGGDITNYKYSLDNGTSYTSLSPADSASPIVISGLTQTQYVIRIKAINVAGDGTASNSVTVTPDPPAVVLVPAIGGVTPPFKGSTPVTTVTAANGYTGTISWSDSPSRFAAATSYTATISLAASPGYTFTGVAANFFTVDGATSVSNLANSGTITAVFPATSAVTCYVVIDRQLTNGYGCSGEVVIEEGVTVIGRHSEGGAFQTNSSITSVVIPASVTEIKDEAFLSATYLTSVAFDNNSNLTKIGGVAFKQTTRLTSITLPSSVNQISFDAFDRSGVQEFTFGGVAPRVIRNGSDFVDGLVSRVFSNGSTNPSTAIGWVTSENLDSFNTRHVLTKIAVRGVTPPFIMYPSSDAYFSAQVASPFTSSYDMSFTEAETATARVSAGTLPPGISMNSSGQFRGTPTTVGIYTVSLTVTAIPDRSRTVTNITFEILRIPPPEITPETFTGYVGIPMNKLIDFYTFGSGTVTLSEGSLPPGLSLTNSNRIFGTPTVAGTYTLRLTVSDSYSQSDSGEFTFNIQSAPSVNISASLSAMHPTRWPDEPVYSVITTEAPGNFIICGFYKDAKDLGSVYQNFGCLPNQFSNFTSPGVSSDEQDNGFENTTWVIRLYGPDAVSEEDPDISTPFLATVTVKVTWEDFYRNWMTPLSSIANGPNVGDIIYASAFERPLPRNLFNPEYENSTRSLPDLEEYVYRITRKPNDEDTSIDHQSHDSYESLTEAEQSKWYQDAGFGGESYRFTWKAFMCVNTAGTEVTKPSRLTLSYASRQDGVLSDGSFNAGHNLMFLNAAIEWQQNVNLGQNLRSAIGAFFGSSETARQYLGEYEPDSFSHIWGFLDIDGSCGAGTTLKALTILHSPTIDEAITTKSFQIPQQLDLLYDDNSLQVNSAGITIGVTGSGPARRDFNAALWGLTTIAASDTVAAPAFTLTPTSVTATVGSPVTSYSINSTGGAIASYSISPAINNGTLSLNTTTGLLTGTPTTVASATPYTITATNATDTATQTFSLTIVARTAPVVEYVPVPVPFLKTLTSPQMHLTSGKLVCTAGTYQTGNTLEGVVQTKSLAVLKPAKYVFNLLINGIAQISQVLTTTSDSAQWEISSVPNASTASCSVSVSQNTLTNTDRSTENTTGLSTASSALATAISDANNAHWAAQSENSKVYQKTLVDNRTAWRADIERIRSLYYSELQRISSLPPSRTTSALKSAALKSYASTQKKATADYKASEPAAALVRNLANNAALIVKDTAIAKANATYGSFIESIGYGVFVP